jgi:hypothetical protein
MATQSSLVDRTLLYYEQTGECPANHIHQSKSFQGFLVLHLNLHQSLRQFSILLKNDLWPKWLVSQDLPFYKQRKQWNKNQPQHLVE